MYDVDVIFDEFLTDLKDLIAIPSVIDEASDNAPFGVAIQEALELALKQAEQLGFETYIDPAGYYGYAQIGEGKELFGVLGHLDVVPVGPLDKWNTNPFEMVIKDGKAYGRGTQDDKGPTLLAMHALYNVVKSGKKLDRRVRFIFGTDEENLWRCMDSYKEKEELPTMGFTPDSEFPVIYAEKGLLQYKLKAKDKINFTLTGGNAFNAVPSEAETDYNETVEQKLKDLSFPYKIVDNKIIAEGKASHSADADKGINAITNLAQALEMYKEESSLLKFILEKGLNFYGEMLYGVVEDEPSGKLTFNIGVATFKENEQEITVDMRLPVTIKKDEFASKIREAAKQYNFEIEEHDYMEAIYVPQDTELIQSLMQAYKEVTNDVDAKPITSGGATYARAMSNCVAFGAVLPSGVETEHQPNECVNLEEMKIALKIYIRAFEMLVTQ